MIKSHQSKPFSIVMADGKTKDFENASELAEFYERMRPRKKRTQKVNFKTESKVIKQDGVAQVFTMEEKPENVSPVNS